MTSGCCDLMLAATTRPASISAAARATSAEMKPDLDQAEWCGRFTNRDCYI